MSEHIQTLGYYMSKNALVNIKEILRIDFQYSDSPPTNYCHFTYSDNVVMRPYLTSSE